MITSQQAAAGSYLRGGAVGFGEAVAQAFRNAFVYHGRASRSAYWWFQLFQVIVVIAVDVVAFGLAASGSPGASAAVLFVILIVSLSLVLAGLSLLVRRLHDTGRSGWWVLAGAVPFAGPVILLVLTLLEGTTGRNGYEPAA